MTCTNRGGIKTGQDQVSSSNVMQRSYSLCCLIKEREEVEIEEITLYCADNTPLLSKAFSRIWSREDFGGRLGKSGNEFNKISELQIPKKMCTRERENFYFNWEM